MPPTFTPPPSRGGSLGSRTSVTGSFGPSAPAPSAGGFTPPPPPPPPAVPPVVFSAPPVGGEPEDYVPNKIRFPKWLRVADVFLVIAAVGTGFLLYKAYSQRVEQNRLAAAAERAAQMQSTARETSYIASEIPFSGKRFLLFRNSRNELMAAVVEAPENARVTWNKGITIDKRDGDVAQFQMRKDGTWKSLGNFGHLTEFAKEIIAGNTNVYDKEGKIVFEPTMCINRHFYRLYEDNVPWSAAKAACESNGGHLVSITTKDEQTFVSQIAAGRYLWTGGSYDPKNKNGWYWAGTAEDMSFTVWDEGQPQDGDHIVLSTDGWIAVNSSGVKAEGYLCEWDVGSMMRTFEEIRKK